jgi:hypothetical protein
MCGYIPQWRGITKKRNARNQSGPERDRLGMPSPAKRRCSRAGAQRQIKPLSCNSSSPLFDLTRRGGEMMEQQSPDPSPEAGISQIVCTGRDSARATGIRLPSPFGHQLAQRRPNRVISPYRFRPSQKIWLGHFSHRRFEESPLQPYSQFLHLRGGQLDYGLFNFCKRAHGISLSGSPDFSSPCFTQRTHA